MQIKLDLTQEEVQQIVDALGFQPLNKVFDVTNKILMQSREQVVAAQMPPSESEETEETKD